jgi:lipid-A-disaccharide synthase-like uncharacterized protein
VDGLCLLLGVAGSAALSMRFLLQWLASERAGESHVPRSFWQLSLAGSLFLLVYALHRGEPIFAIAYLPGPLVFLRNLALLRRNGAPASRPPS